MTDERGSQTDPTSLLVGQYPKLYHMAADGSWPSIRRHGLLSTTALLDLFEVTGEQRRALELTHRPESVVIHHPVHGVATVRDQKPLSVSKLQKSLTDMSIEEWFALLNRMVFFWPTRDRLDGLAGARAYRDDPHHVLVVDSKSLVSQYAGQLQLSHMNSGTTSPMAFPRGSDTFKSLQDFPLEQRIKKSRMGAVAEVTVPRGVPDIASHVLRVERVVGATVTETIWKRS